MISLLNSSRIRGLILRKCFLSIGFSQLIIKLYSLYIFFSVQQQQLGFFVCSSSQEQRARKKPKLLAALGRVVHFVYSRKARAHRLRSSCPAPSVPPAPLDAPDSPPTWPWPWSSAPQQVEWPGAHVCKNVYTNHKIQATSTGSLTYISRPRCSGSGTLGLGFSGQSH